MVRRAVLAVMVLQAATDMAPQAAAAQGLQAPADLPAQVAHLAPADLQRSSRWISSFGGSSVHRLQQPAHLRAVHPVAHPVADRLASAAPVAAVAHSSGGHSSGGSGGSGGSTGGGTDVPAPPMVLLFGAAAAGLFARRRVAKQKKQAEAA